jgi:hypothetical protein
MKERTWPMRNEHGVVIPMWVGDWRIASWPNENLPDPNRSEKMRVGVEAHKDDFNKMLRSGNR